MLRIYLRLAVRSLLKRRGYAAINVLGLAVGLGCCLLIGLFIADETSYDRFHENADRLVLVAREHSFGGKTDLSTATQRPLARALETDVPGIEKAATTWGGGVAIGRPDEDTAFGALFADSTFFDLFTFPLTQGDAATALDRPDAVAISASMARALFGDAGPLGQRLQVEVLGTPIPLTVTGVFGDPPRTSSLDFDAVASLGALREVSFGDSWGASMYQTYALLIPDASEAALTRSLEALVDTHLGPDDDTVFPLVPLPDLYLSELTRDEGFRGSARYLLIFGSIAFFVLFVGMVNYMNLATARAAGRAQEVGVHKTLGAGRGQIARQFLVEALVVTGAAFALGLGLAALALPVFNGFFGKELSLAAALTPGVAAVGVGLLLTVGLVSGSYPAFYLSGLQPARILNRETGGRGSAAWLRRALVVVQFAVTVVLLVATIVVARQLHYVQTTDLGFAGDQVLSVRFADDAMANQHDAVKAAVLGGPGVLSASATNAPPGLYYNQYAFNPDPDDPDRQVSAYVVNADPDYLATLGLSLVEGRGFEPQRTTDETEAFILNEEARDMLGGLGAVGATIHDLDPETNRVIGVVENYHFASLREPIGPVLIRVGEPVERPWPDYSRLVVRFDPERIGDVQARLSDVWAQFGAAGPPEPRFLDDAFAEMYATEQRLGQAFGVFALVAVVIACLGLFGLAAFAAEQRTKEIGIRKVLGASVANLVGLLSKEFLALVVVAFVVAAPLAWLAMTRWLAGFAYRIEVGPGIFAAAGLVALTIALVSVAGQALRAATADPVKSLRSE